MTSDPFESLYQNSGTSQLYISGRLTLLRVPSWLNPGEWIRFPDHPTHSAWHRRLTAHAFLWLRSAVNRVVIAGNVAQGFEDAPQTIERIAAIGVEAGALTIDDIGPHETAPEWFSFNAGLPVWADDIGFEFPPSTPLTPPTKTIKSKYEEVSKKTRQGAAETSRETKSTGDDCEYQAGAQEEN